MSTSIHFLNLSLALHSLAMVFLLTSESEIKRDHYFFPIPNPESDVTKWAVAGGDVRVSDVSTCRLLPGRLAP